MSENQTLLKKKHTFKDFLYWNLFIAIPIVTACIAILKESVAWLIIYIVVSIFLFAVIYRFYCTHCPHYIQGGQSTTCMFFWGIPKLFDSRPGPLSLFEKFMTFAATIILIVFPFYWLISSPGLLVIYVLSMVALLTTIRRNECSRCVYFHCPVNCVPEDLKS